MDSISKRQTKTNDVLRTTLVVSRIFFPRTGGIEEYAYNRCLQNPENVMVLAAGCPGDRNFDEQQPFPIYRWSMPQVLLKGFIGKLLKQVFSMTWSFIMPIWLYFRREYLQLEWSHGYDFSSLFLLTFILPVRFIVCLHGNDILCPLRNSLLRSWFTWTLNRSDQIICNSSFTKNYLLANCSIKTPIKIINPQIRPTKFGSESLTKDELDDLRTKIRNRYQIPHTAVTILTVGRLVRRKGFDRVIKCLPQLQTEEQEVHYLVCGKGSMAEELGDIARNLEVADKVHFAGFVSDHDLAAYYSACDIFAMLTFLEENEQSIEGFGIVYLEAGYFGKPVIASRVGGVVDAVKENQNGILTDPDSDVEILSGLQQLCQNTQLRQRLGNTGKAMALGNTSLT